MPSEVLKVQGLGRLANKLRKLGPKVARKVIKKGVRAGGGVLAKAERKNAPFKTGRLRDAIRVYAAKRKKKAGVISVVVWPSRKGFEKDRYYGPFVIQGHKVRGTSGRRVPADDFVGRAFAIAREKAAAAAMDSIRAGIKRAWDER